MPVTHASLMADIEHQHLLDDIDARADELIPAEDRQPRRAAEPKAWRGDRGRMVTRSAWALTYAPTRAAEALSLRMRPDLVPLLPVDW